MSLIVEESGFSSAEANMAKDSKLLENLGKNQQRLLHFYEWDRPSATFGFFSNPHKFIKESAISSKSLSLAKRPTGGGIIFHIWDFTFSLLMPASDPQFSINTLDNYQMVNRMVIHAIKQVCGELHLDLTLLQEEAPSLNVHCSCFCMAKPSLADVMWKRKKVAGGAQRRTKHGFLHQGTISLCSPDLNFLREVIHLDCDILEEIHKYSGALLPHTATPKEKVDFKNKLKKCLIEAVKLS